MKELKNIKRYDKDISNEEIERLHLPFNNNLDNLMIKYVIPEVVAFQLANSYYRGCLCDSTFEQHFKSMRDLFNVFPKLEEVKSEIIELLKIKYNLKISNENPLTFEKWE